MRPSTAFWDSSALVPLCVQEPRSRWSRFYLMRMAPVVWWGSLVEIHSAIIRLHREKEISAPAATNSAARLRMLSRSWNEISPSEPVRELALQLQTAYPLHAADSLQLAASLIWCAEHPSGRNFLCADRQLAKAAGAVGFSVVEISA